ERPRRAPLLKWRAPGLAREPERAMQAGGSALTPNSARPATPPTQTPARPDRYPPSRPPCLPRAGQHATRPPRRPSPRKRQTPGANGGPGRGLARGSLPRSAPGARIELRKQQEPGLFVAAAVPLDADTGLFALVALLARQHQLELGAGRRRAGNVDRLA